MNDIEAKAQQILRRFKVTDPPVPIAEIAEGMGLELEPAALGEGVSGLLVVEGGKGKIGYNRSHPEVRQRFTIAHELGHYVLHSQTQHLFIDRSYSVYLRSGASSKGVDAHEIQANQMAAALLMPAALVRRAARSTAFDLGDEEGLRGLARQFNVSSQAMSFRLVNLGLVDGAAGDR